MNGTNAVLIAGGSDLMPRIKRQLIKPAVLVDLSPIRELHYIKRDGDQIRVGALSTISELAASSILSGKYEAFRQVEMQYGGPAIRNIATIGGNVASAASSEDLIPVLLSLDATVAMKSVKGERSLPVKDFLVGKRKTILSHEELITEISFRELNSTSWCTFEKVGRRKSLIIALVSLAVCLDLDPESHKVNQIRVALNRVKEKIPQRVQEVEMFLAGKVLNDDTIVQSLKVLEDALSLTADYRASAEYRVEAAKACLESAIKHCVKMMASKREAV